MLPETLPRDANVLHLVNCAVGQDILSVPHVFSDFFASERWIKMALWKKILYAIVGIILAVTFFVGVSAFRLSVQIVESFQREITELTASNTVNQMRTYFSDVRDTLTKMVEETDTHAIAEYNDLNEETRIQITNTLESKVESFLDTGRMVGNSTFHFINIYLENGVEAITTNNNSLPYTSFTEVCSYLDEENILARDAYKNLVWYDIVTLTDEKSVPNNCFLCVRFLYDRVTMERIGAIVAGIDTDSLWNMYKGIFPKARIINKWGEVVVSGKDPTPMPETLLETLNDSTSTHMQITYDANSKQITALCWRVANGYAWFVVPLQETSIWESDTIARFVMPLIIVVAAAILVACIFAVIFSKSVTNGLAKLTKIAQRVADGERDARFIPKKHDEVAYVGLQFNHMLDQLQIYYTNLQQYEKEKTDLELSLLNAKINPHLLYNTLDIVIWTIKKEDHQRAEQIIYALSAFFKRALAKGRMYTTLEEEVELIRSYMELQCLAGTKDYCLQTDIDPQLADFEVLHLLLQPIVENSVAHGFQAFRDDGTIRISARREGADVVLNVRDDGIGMMPDRVAEINFLLSEALYAENNKHYGLYNIARRIKTYYGKDYVIALSSEMGEYTDVTIRIPYSKQEVAGEEDV